MAETHVVSGLVAKRSELAGLIEHYQAEMRRIGSAIGHIDAAIKLFDPDYDLRTIRAKAHRKRNMYFKQGECSRLVLDILRQANTPMATDEVAVALMKGKGLDTNDAELVKFTKKAAITALRQQANRNLIQSLGLDEDGLTLRWEMAS